MIGFNVLILILSRKSTSQRYSQRALMPILLLTDCVMKGSLGANQQRWQSVCELNILPPIYKDMQMVDNHSS